MVSTKTTPATGQTIDIAGVDVTKTTGLIAASEAVTTPTQVNHKFKLAADVIQKTCADLPDDDRSDVLWFGNYCRRKDFSKTELGTVLRKPGSTEHYSSDSIVQLLTGGRIRRGENIAPMLEAIRALRRVQDLRKDMVESGFIETRLYREMENRLLKALKRRRVAFFFGDGQIGKTENFKEFTRRNETATVYLELPASGNFGQFIRAVARAAGIPDSSRQSDLAERCIEAFNSSMILIVDEAHRALGSRFTNGGVAVFSWLRELFNRKQCAIAVAFTNEGRDKFLRGPLAKTFEQFWRRRITPLQLPAAPPDDDAALFAEAYGLEPAPDKKVKIEVTVTNDQGRPETKEHTDNPLRLQREVLQSEGLGVWIGILQDASDMSQEQKRPITWGAVIKAHAQAQAESEIMD